MNNSDRGNIIMALKMSVRYGVPMTLLPEEAAIILGIMDECGSFGEDEDGFDEDGSDEEL